MLRFWVIFCISVIQSINGFWDDRDYHDDFHDDSDELPDGWVARIDPDIMKAHLANLNRRGSLENDIMFADSGLGIASEYVGGRRNLTLWPSGKVPYHISDAFGSQDVFLIKEAMLTIESKTFRCVKFVERKSDRNYISFKPGKNCSSYVGLQDLQDGQPVFLDPDRCMQLGVVQHEILHALGLFHEHSRSDRDSSVIIYKDEIMDGYKAQYDIIPNMPTFGTDYDLESLMHYGMYDFAKTMDWPVIIPRKDGVYRMGQREGLSVRDVAKLRNAYYCQVDQGFEDQDPEKRSFSGFSGLPMQTDQCALQFNSYCENKKPKKCTKDRMLVMNCKISADASFLRTMATAMAKAPVRPIVISLTDIQITSEALYPIENQVVEMLMSYCRTRDATAKLSSFSFANLQVLTFGRCIDLRIKKSDFKFLPMLRVVTFLDTTILYLEEGTFTNLPKLLVIAWHSELQPNFGTIKRQLASGGDDHGHIAERMVAYLKRMHCDCEFAWLRRWLHESGMLEHAPKGSEVYNFNDDELFVIPEITRNDIYIPIDCAKQPFPIDFTMIDFAQTEFSVNEPHCPAPIVNATYDSFKFKRTFSRSRISIAQCRLQFGKSCKPWHRSSVRSATESTVLDYCQNQLNSSQLALVIGCPGNTTVREAQEISFGLAKPPLRTINLNVDDGDYLVYRAFAPVKTQTLSLRLYDCVMQQTTAKLRSLGFEGLLYLAFAYCQDMIVQTDDFAAVPNIRVLLFFQSTLVDVTQFTFASLPNLEILSMEYKAVAVLDVDLSYYQYLRKLHCDCQYSLFRKWLQRRIIHRLQNAPLNSVNNSYDNGNMTHCLVEERRLRSTFLRFDIEGGTYSNRFEWTQEELYPSFDCADEHSKSGFRRSIHICNRGPLKYSFNVPSCKSTVATSLLPVTLSEAKPWDKNVTVENRTATPEKDWTVKLSKPILQERRSEFTAQAVDAAGSVYHYDDQALSTDPAGFSGLLATSRFWPNNGKDVPYLISEAFDISDKEEVKDSLSSISTYTSQCVTFKAREMEEDYIFFRLGQRCQSSVGRQGGQQNITLSQACIFRGAIQHLVLHALGLFHENQRADRDEYLRIYLNRTELPSNSILLRKLPQMPSYGTEYDLESIMHYGAFDLSDPQRPDLPVFLPKKTVQKGKRIKMGQRRTLSAKDIVKLYTAYNCTMQAEPRGGYEPLPNFLKSRLSPPVCDQLAKVKCASANMNNCTSQRMIFLSCDNSTTIEDWEQAAAVSKLQLYVVVLDISDSGHMDAAPDAFRSIRRQILLASFSYCRDSRFTMILATFGYVNVMDIDLQWCYGLIIRKKDFCGFPRLQILTFSSSTISYLEAGTFTSLSDLKLLSIEQDLFDPTSLAFNVSRTQLVDYLYTIHCGCDFADFRMWRKNNKALRMELEPGEITFLEVVVENGRISRRDVFFPVDCHKRDAEFNLAQVEYSINEPLCEAGTTSSTVSSDADPCKAAFMKYSHKFEKRPPLMLSENTSQRATHEREPPYPVNGATGTVSYSAPSFHWIYGCLGGVAALCVVLALYLARRRIGRPFRRGGNSTTLESGPLLAGNVATVGRPRVYRFLPRLQS
ncbi:uncharacterized protein LOC129586039 [Paramacrobiotus metropolitanus]|uniref:uncharacterized protein LOC129586039 n=1 Tax=Paramacrobiotus metropolitanus TaxID=2943436 RepID=UPI002445BE77|nr:uncharacterized protein LOC129586039 [Paramacrobiotus metropolitanus]